MESYDLKLYAAFLLGLAPIIQRTVDQRVEINITHMINDVTSVAYSLHLCFLFLSLKYASCYFCIEVISLFIK